MNGNIFTKMKIKKLPDISQKGTGQDIGSIILKMKLSPLKETGMMIL